jgi:hypothetical protein
MKSSMISEVIKKNENSEDWILINYGVSSLDLLAAGRHFLSGTLGMGFRNCYNRIVLK